MYIMKNVRVLAGKVIGSLFALALVLSAVAPTVASAQFTLFQGGSGGSGGSVSSGFAGGACANLRTGGFVGVVDCVIIFFNYFIYIITALTVVYVVVGAFRLTNEEKREDGKQMIYHGIIGLFIMSSIWGLVNILDSTFNLSGSSPMIPPTIERTF